MCIIVLTLKVKQNRSFVGLSENNVDTQGVGEQSALCLGRVVMVKVACHANGGRAPHAQ